MARVVGMVFHASAALREPAAHFHEASSGPGRKALAAETGIESVDELAACLSSLDFESMSALLEGLFGG